MSLTHIVVGMLWLVLMILGADRVSGQTYPNKPIRIVTSSVGGGNDYITRQVAQGLTGPLGQPVIVENRGGGIIQFEIVAKARPDGYTLLVSTGTMWLGPLLQNTSYDPVRDFAPISIMTKTPVLLVVNPSLPVKSVKELIALAKARPGELNYAYSGTGSTSHLGAELFKAMAGVNIVRVPYKGMGQAHNDLIASQVQMLFDTGSAMTAELKSGKLRALAVTSTQPSALFPDLPTVAATLPGVELASIVNMFAPANSPTTIIDRLNQEIVRVLSRADVKERLLSIGVETAGSSREELAAWIKADMARMGKVIKDAGIRLE